MQPFYSEVFLDNGGGMDPDKMRHCMSLGYSAKSKMADTIGQCKLSLLSFSLTLQKHTRTLAYSLHCETHVPATHPPKHRHTDTHDPPSRDASLDSCML